MMLKALIDLSLRHKRLVLLLAGLFCLWAGLGLGRAAFEVFPDFVPAQASVQVEAPGLTASQVELLVTDPLEASLSGATGVETVRSQSVQGLSLIDVTFRDGEDPYRARQVVAERLAEAAGRLPASVGAPSLSPLTSSTMDLLKIGLVSDRLSPQALREFAQFVVKPRLLAARGVARVNVFGGELARIEVQVRPDALLAHDVSLQEVETAVREAVDIRGGGFVDTPNQRILIEPRGAQDAVGDLAKAVLAPKLGPPLTLADVADVRIAAAPQFGDALIMGRPGVLMTLGAQYGANTLAATKAVEAALAELGPTLAGKGVKLYPTLHRPANFIETALTGIARDLAIGSMLIVAVLLFFVPSLRVALIAFVSIPLSLLAATTVFGLFGQSLNTMILGGLAVALGVVIDDAVIGTENIVRRLRQADRALSPAAVISAATLEVRAPVVSATFVLGLSMAPVALLTGLQGAFFAPLAIAFMLAVFASLIVALTLSPALALLMLAKGPAPAENPWLGGLRRAQRAVLRPLMRRPVVALVFVLGLGVAAAIGAARFGGELLPAFRERHYVLSVVGPPGASIEWMRDVGARISKDLLAIPGVASVEQQIGRAEAGEDAFPPNESEMHVELAKVDGAQEDEILKAIRTVLGRYRGLETEALTFLGDRIGESLSGETAAIVISAYGPDLDALDQAAMRIAETVRRVDGAVDVRVQTPPGAPAEALSVDSAALGAHGISRAEAADAIEMAFQGKPLAQIAIGQRTMDAVATLPRDLVSDPEQIGALPVRGASGALTRLDQVARAFPTVSRAAITHDGGRRRQVVTANSREADVAGLARRIASAIAHDVRLPPDVYLEYSGAAEGQKAARRELLFNVGLAGLGVIVVLGLAFGGPRPAALILSSAPAALAGGAAVVAVSGGILSLGALVGFVTLFGVAVRNAILLVSHVDQLVAEQSGRLDSEAVLRASGERLAPILMTALVTGLGMAPLALTSGEAGREVQGPMAGVILGGLVSSTLMTIFLLPPLILAFRQKRARGRDPERAPPEAG